MTQEELRKKIASGVFLDSIEDSAVDEVMQLINQHVAEVIGEDDPEGSPEANFSWNLLRAEQRERAGLTKEDHG